MYRRFTDSINEESDNKPAESLHEIITIFGVSKSEKSIKYHHKRLNWYEHVQKLQHTKKFLSGYHVTVPAFNRVVKLLRPRVGVDKMNSRNPTSNNEPSHPGVIVGAGLRFIGGWFCKAVKDIYGIFNHSARCIISMFVMTVRTYREMDTCLLQTTTGRNRRRFCDVFFGTWRYCGFVGYVHRWLVCINTP